MVENTNPDSDLDLLLEEVRSDTRAKTSRPSLLSLCCLYATYTCEYAPRFCFALACVCLLIPTYFLIMTVLNPTEQFGVVRSDFTNINSKYDLSVGKIDHWCLRGDNDSCRCEDPLQPQARAEFRKWTNAHIANKEMVNTWVQQNKNPDMCFLGASVVEEMDGRWFGGGVNDTDLRGLGKLFNRNFQKANGATVDALALGIAGDTNPSILWRLINGEMPASFNPKIWWLELGMNDLGRTQCSEEVVILGILRVVEEIINQKPDSKIVINSMLPMAKMRSFGEVKPMNLGFKDSFFKDTIEKKEGANFGHRRLGEDGDEAITVFDQQAKSRRLGFFSRLFGGEEDEVGQPPQKVRMSAAQLKQKKYDALLKQRKIPLWTSIHAINEVLRKWCANHDGVFFFDATEIFAEREDGKFWTLRTDTISLRGHPTKAGFKKWETAVVSRAKELLSDNNN